MNILEHTSDKLAGRLEIALEAALRVARNQVGMEVLAEELGQFGGLNVCLFPPQAFAACLTFAPEPIGIHHRRFVKLLRRELKGNNEVLE